MKIEVNGELKEFSSKMNLREVVDSVVADTNGTAVALNNSVVSKNSWSDTTLNENDKVLIIKATQGG